MKVDFDIRDLNRNALERMVKQLLTASDKEEREMMKKLQKRAEKNDLADLDEEMHGKPNAPEVTDEDLPYKGDDELPDVPKKKEKK
jgi:L-2-hydroxyglutarate oxidase LhgO